MMDAELPTLGMPETTEAASALSAMGSEVAEEEHTETAMDEDEDDFEIPQRYTKSGRKRAVTFPLKLMKALSNKEFSHIITWMPSGKSFSILKPKVFAAEILPEYFKSAKYSSFTRKLHRWGFAKHYKGDDAGAFYHKDFQKDRIDLAEKMTCLKAPEPPKSEAFSEEELAAGATRSSVQATTEQEHHESLLRRASLPVMAARFPPVVQMSSSGASLQASSLLNHRFHQPSLSIPVPKQQHLQRHFAAPNPLTSLHSVADVPSSQNTLVAAKINAAIELEVSRRLQERISVAAAQMSQMSREHAALNNLLPLTPQTAVQRTSLPIGDPVVASSESLRAKLAQMQQQKEQMQYLAMTGMVPIPSQGLGKLPETNIQSAKTA